MCVPGLKSKVITLRFASNPVNNQENFHFIAFGLLNQYVMREQEVKF